jgi:hypothetical protein
MLCQEIKESLDRKETMQEVFVDFKNANDSVWKVNLMVKREC